MKIYIVDNSDKIIGAKERAELKQSDIFRASALWVTNSKGEILIAQRSQNTSHDGGKWGHAVVGTLDVGETYDGNIIKEAKEELGLNGINPTKGPKTRVTKGANFFNQWFILKIDKQTNEFKLQKEEVAAVRWVSKEELRNELLINPEKFVPAMKECVELFLK